MWDWILTKVFTEDGQRCWKDQAMVMLGRFGE